MERRAFVLGAALASLLEADQGKIPTDPQDLNSFVETYNFYAAQLTKGIVDVKAWGRVERAWKRLVT